MASYKSRVYAIPGTAIAGAAIGGDFAQINANGLPFACYMLRIINENAFGINVSYDGVTAHDRVPANQSIQLWIDDTTLFSKGLIVWVSGVGGGAASAYLAGYYKVPVNA
jgi:hypothetical protein